MSDIIYKKFSELDETTSLAGPDLFPIAQYISGISYNSKAVTFSTVNNQVSGALISPFTASIQSTINSTLSSDKWNSTYTTVRANSATWGATVNDTLTAFSQGNTTAPGNTMTVRFLSAGTTANASVAFIANGTGATLAHLPDGGVTGGNARGQYATDWQKARTGASQVASGNYSTVGGGSENTASQNWATVGGGASNVATGYNSTIGGGSGSTASGGESTIGGGNNNTASGDGSVVGGGYNNTASGMSSVVRGGISNTASGTYSDVGGLLNTASGNYSTILGGQLNNTNSKSNAHIIGSNMTAPSANFTYVNNISSQGDVRGANFYGPNIIKAWVNFDGSPTTGSATINSSYNVSSVTINAAGDFTVNFPAGVFTNVYYVVAGGASGNQDASVVIASSGESTAPTLKSTTQCKITIKQNATTATVQPKEVGVMFIGL